MLKKSLITFSSLIGLSSISMAADFNDYQDSAGATLLPIIFLVFFAIYIFISVRYIMSQQSLSNAYSDANQTDKISGAWFWTQLIPLWNMVAIIVCVTKISEQAKTFSQNTGIKATYNPTLFYCYFGISFLSMIPLIGLVAILASFILWIIFWVNLSSSKKQVLEHISQRLLI
ncbi:hypothetical protein [Francisella sp. LA112445]|uniref:hypothetical protein n=1 Tax=Francisella sp. LA112445 TaxID=1395624 RepID=UPI001788A9BB|nr:hypothetical protein [Francisella sp. LA112445]QIW10665.1 hypothetical protein FIP56_08105 [Francisella sp. LA112445]